MATDPPTVDRQFVAPLLGAEARSLIDCNQKLSELGLDSIDDTIKLPRICVIGDQSTGKSSLIQAISGIKVPKAANLCTRCPIAINLSSRGSNNVWECSVYIEERYTYNKTIKQKASTKTHPLGPWQLQDEPTVTLVATTNDPNKVVDLINTAANLVLNPHRKRESIIDSSTKKDLEIFSPNIVRVDCTLANQDAFGNLSFVDLMGNIQSAGKSQPAYLVTLVEALSREYAADPRNQLILCYPLNHDTNNSKSYSIIQQQKAQPHTLAVFTKVDLAREEERQDCLDKYFQDNSDEEFGYGHHIVMLKDSPGSDEDGLKAEAQFFDQEPWDSLATSTRERLGIKNLTTFLRKILYEKTAETLPGILDKILSRVAQLEDHLEKMPAPPDSIELPYRLREHVSTFERNIQDLFKSGQGDSSVSSRNNLMDAMHNFNKRVQSDAPTAMLRAESETQELDQARKILRDDAEPSVATAEDNDVNERSTYSTATPNGKPKDKRSHSFRLEDIEALNKKYYQSSIPGDIELKAVQEMHRLSVHSWRVTFSEFMRTVKHVIYFEVLECVHKTFEPLAHLPLYAHVEVVVKEYLGNVIQNERIYMQRLCDAETQQPLTFDHVGIRKAEAENLELRRNKRAASRLEVERMVRKANALITKKKPKEPTLEDIGPDPWDVEVQMAAKTRAYYDVASHRFVDSVCQSIFAHLVPLLSENLVDHVRDQIGLNDIAGNRDSIVALMTEDADREALRLRVLNELERLNAGHAYIANVLETFRNPSSQNHAAPQAGIDGDAMVFESAISMDGIGGTTYISPAKRTATAADITTTEVDEPETPSKRVRRQEDRQPSPLEERLRRSTRLPSRGKSIEIED